MAKAEVYAADANPRVDRPLYFLTKTQLTYRLESGSLLHLGGRSYIEARISPKELNFRLAIVNVEAGYDAATASRPKVPNKSPWQIWLFNFSWERPLEWTNGWPVRMRCGLGHYREEQVRSAKKPPAREVLAGEELQTGTL